MATAAAESVLSAKALGRHFGQRWVLRGVTFGVERGEAAAIIGPNGSGKSTVLRVLGTLLKPSAGTGSVDGFDIVAEAAGVRQKVGYLAHTPGLYDDLTARENVRFAADMLGVDSRRADECLERAGLEKVSTMRVRGFSAGMQRRVALARLLLRRSRVLLLDEPYANLDEDGIALMNSVIREALDDGGAALIALHELSPARPILSRTMKLAEGRIASESSEVPRERLSLASG